MEKMESELNKLREQATTGQITPKLLLESLPAIADVMPYVYAIAKQIYKF